MGERQIRAYFDPTVVVDSDGRISISWHDSFVDAYAGDAALDPGHPQVQALTDLVDTLVAGCTQAEGLRRLADHIEAQERPKLSETRTVPNGRTYDVTMSNRFEATSPLDAVAQMAAWAADSAYSAGYRVVAADDGDATFIDAEELETFDIDEEL
jgi:hypothetical protein